MDGLHVGRLARRLGAPAAGEEERSAPWAQDPRRVSTRSRDPVATDPFAPTLLPVRAHLACSYAVFLAIGIDITLAHELRNLSPWCLRPLSLASCATPLR